MRHRRYSGPESLPRHAARRRRPLGRRIANSLMGTVLNQGMAAILAALALGGTALHYGAGVPVAPLVATWFVALMGLHLVQRRLFLAFARRGAAGRGRWRAKV
jgi:hypothetical protein